MTDRTAKARKALKDVTSALKKGYVTPAMVWDLALVLGLILDELEEVRSND